MAATYQPSQWLIPKNANTDKVGNYCFELDGTSDYIDFGTSPTYTNVSISFWVKRTTDPSNESLFNGTGIFQWLQFTSNQNYLSYYDGSWNVFSGDVSDDDWHHVVIINDISATEVRSYVDGSLDTTISSYDATSILYQFGNYNGVSHFLSGKYTEICIFNYILDTDDITTLHGSAGAGVGNPMALDVVPVAYYKGDRAALGDQWAVANQGVSKNYALEFSAGYVTSPPWAGYQGLLASTTSIGTVSHITMSCWFNSTVSTSTQSKVFNTTGVTIYINNDRVYIAASGPSYRYWSGETLFDGNWHNLVIYIPNGSPTWTISDSRVYIDTVESTMIPWGSLTGNEITDINGMFKSGVGGGGTIPIKMSNWAYWLSDEQSNISTIFNNGIPGDLTSLSPDVWWKLDADNVTIASQVDVTDSSGNAVTGSGPLRADTTFPALVGTDVNAAGGTLATDYSFEFDGVGDHFGASATGISSAITVSAWIKTSTTGIQTIVNEDQAGGAGTRNWNLLLEPGNKIQIVIINTDGSANNKLRSTALEVQDGKWHNIVFTYDGTADVDGLKTYVDGGNLESFQTTSTGIITTDTLGVYTGGLQVTGLWPFTGNISNVAIWNSALSAANILAIYNNGRPADLTSLSPTVWWRLGENASYDGSDWTTPDQIGSNDGTSAGNPVLVGEAPQSFLNGLSVSMDINDRVGESGFSDENALSYNMAYDARKADVAG